MISTHHIVVTSLVAGRSQPILDEITLSLRPSTITVMIGPNGAGKSTLLRVMAGLIRPKTGSVILHHGDHQFHLYGDLPHADAHREQNCDRAPHQTLPLRPRFFRRFSMMNFLKETRDPKVSKTVSWYGDSSPIVFPYSVEDLVMMGRFAHHQGWPKAHDRACVQEALGELGIEDLRHRLAPTLS